MRGAARQRGRSRLRDRAAAWPGDTPKETQLYERIDLEVRLRVKRRLREDPMVQSQRGLGLGDCKDEGGVPNQ
jgi:hypothetical protein